MARFVVLHCISIWIQFTSSASVVRFVGVTLNFYLDLVITIVVVSVSALTNLVVYPVVPSLRRTLPALLQISVIPGEYLLQTRLLCPVPLNIATALQLELCTEV